MLYNRNGVKMENPPEFYTGVPVDPVDLRFHETFLPELLQTFRTAILKPWWRKYHA